MNNIPVIFGKRGRTTIPQPLREKLGWQAGDVLRFRLDGKSVVISCESASKPPAPAPTDTSPNPLILLLLRLIGGGGNV